jgi:hypothetical protein
MKYSANDYLGKILMGLSPTNQTTMDMNPPKFLCKSFDGYVVERVKVLKWQQKNELS